MSEFDRLWIVNRLTLYDAYQGQVKEDVADCIREIDRLRAENERMRAVVEAAQEWRKALDGDYGYKGMELYENALHDAVDAYNAGKETE